MKKFGCFLSLFIIWRTFTPSFGLLRRPRYLEGAEYIPRNFQPSNNSQYYITPSPNLCHYLLESTICQVFTWYRNHTCFIPCDLLLDIVVNKFAISFNRSNEEIDFPDNPTLKLDGFDIIRSEYDYDEEIRYWREIEVEPNGLYQSVQTERQYRKKRQIVDSLDTQANLGYDNATELVERPTKFFDFDDWREEVEEGSRRPLSVYLLEEHGQQYSGLRIEYRACLSWQHYWSLGLCRQTTYGFDKIRYAAVKVDSSTPVGLQWYILATGIPISGKVMLPNMTIDSAIFCDQTAVRAKISNTEEEPPACLVKHMDEILVPVEIFLNTDLIEFIGPVTVGGVTMQFGVNQDFKRCLGWFTGALDRKSLCHTWLAWIPVVRHSKSISLKSGDSCHYQDVSIPLREDNIFTSWSSWTECSAKCGEGTSLRVRSCLPGAEDFCRNKTLFTESKQCSSAPCKGKNNYLQWSDWSPCDKQCLDNSLAPGVKRRERGCADDSCDPDGFVEESFCWGNPEPNFCTLSCDLIDVDLQKSYKSEILYELTVQMRRPPKGALENIKQQTLLVRDASTEGLAAEHRWVLNHRDDEFEEANRYVTNKLDFECEGCSIQNTTCSCTFKSLRLEHIYNMSLILQEYSSFHFDDSGKTILIDTYCSHSSVELTRWRCHSNNQSIPAKSICDSVEDCEDGSDEAMTMCQGQSSILEVLLPLAALLVIEIIILIILTANGNLSIGDAAIEEDLDALATHVLSSSEPAAIPWSQLSASQVKQILCPSLLCLELAKIEEVIQSIVKHFGEETALKLLKSCYSHPQHRKLVRSLVKPSFFDRLQHYLKAKYPEAFLSVTCYWKIFKSLLLAPLSLYDIFKDLTLVLVLFYFSTFVLQSNFERIGELNLNGVVGFLIAMFLVTHLATTAVRTIKLPTRDLNVKMNKWFDLLTILPGWHSLLVTWVTIRLNWKILRISRKFATGKNDSAQSLRALTALKKKLLHIGDQMRDIKVAEAVMEQFPQCLVCITILFRSSLRIVFVSTITQNINGLLEALLAISMLSLCWKLCSYKRRGKLGSLSPGALLSFFNMILVFGQKIFLYILYSFQLPYLILPNVMVMTAVHYLFNSKHNVIFRKKRGIDQIIFSMVSALIPMTLPLSDDTESSQIKDMNGDVMLKNRASERKDGEIVFVRRNMFHQGLFSYSVSMIESCVVLILVLVQKQASPHYSSSLDAYLSLPFSWSVVLVIVLAAYCLSALISLIYYRHCHPWSSINEVLPLWEPALLLPIVTERREVLLADG